MLATSLAAVTQNGATPQRAVLTFATLANFVTHLRDVAARHGSAPVAEQANREDIPHAGFDLDVEGIALAAAARIFAFDDDVIALIDDAQYHRRPVHIGRTRGGAPVMMAATTSDADGEANPSLSDFHAKIETIAAATMRQTAGASYELYARWITDACQPHIDALDATVREAGRAVARDHGYLDDGNTSDADFGPGTCPTSGIDADFCHCGRHP